MKNHNTHYATLRLDRKLCDRPAFVICYTYLDGRFRGFLTGNRRITPTLGNARVFFDYHSALDFVPFDFRIGSCFILEFQWDSRLLRNVPVRVFRDVHMYDLPVVL